MIVDDDRYEVEEDPYCYPGTNILKNKANLRDVALLRDFELEMTALRADEKRPSGAYDLKHYRAVHRHLFRDVYTWAGKYRTVRMSKGKNPFCFPEHIEAEATKVFQRLDLPAFKPGSTSNEFVEAAADFLAELNAVHCFRDGNGRAQLTFLHLIAERAGHPLQLEKIERGPFLAAMIASFDRKLDPLKAQLANLL